jgi:methyltransferase family protein
MGKLRFLRSRLPYVLRHGLVRGITLGHCPICERRTVFFKEGAWLRDQFKCIRCFSIPRWRAIVVVLEKFFPKWRELTIHESSPGGAASDKLARECKSCVQTHWFQDIPLGQKHAGYRCEDLERQTFSDAEFDLVVTQDVFEHVLDPAKGFAEIARTLKPGGAHVFTIPWYYWKPTLVRASRNETGRLRHHVKPDYHDNPIDPKGSLVVTEWGADFCELVFRVSGLTTTVVHIHDSKQGIEADFIEVFISRKAAADSLNQVLQPTGQSVPVCGVILPASRPGS